MILPELDDLLRRLKREEARENLNLFSVLNHASQGSSKENKTFLEALKEEAKIAKPPGQPGQRGGQQGRQQGGLAGFLQNLR